MIGDIQVVKAVMAKELATAAFATVLATVDAELNAAIGGTAITTTAPQSVCIFDGEKVETSGNGYPVAEIIGGRTAYDGASQELKDATHELQIIWTHVGDDELTITKQLERLVKATRDFFWPANGSYTLPGMNARPLEIVSEEYTALLPTRDRQYGAFVKGAGTTLRVGTLTL